MTDHRSYAVNLNEGRQHVVHRHPAFEECNVDDADKKVYVDRIEADELTKSGAAVLCEHCLGAGLDYDD